MDIDRSRFLLLTASLAAAACTPTTSATIPETGGGGDPASTNKDSEDEPGETAADASAPQVWLEIEPGSEDAPPSRATGTCDNNSVRGPVTCQLSPPSGHCESFDWTVRVCDSLPELLVPRVAEATVDCMQAASGTQRICAWEVMNECVEAGLQVACVDATTRSQCQSISSACGGSVDVFHCQQGVSSVPERFRDQLGSCIQEFCEVPMCISDLQYFI